MERVLSICHAIHQSYKEVMAEFVFKGDGVQAIQPAPQKREGELKQHTAQHQGDEKGKIALPVSCGDIHQPLAYGYEAKRHAHVSHAGHAT